MRAARFQAGALRDPPQQRVKGSQPSYIMAKGYKQALEGDNAFCVRRLRNIKGRLQEICRQQTEVCGSWPASLGLLQGDFDPYEASATVERAIQDACSAPPIVKAHGWAP